MRKLLLILIFFIPSIPIFSDDVESVKIYSSAEEKYLGRALNRSDITEVKLYDFFASESLSCGANGINTAIIIDSNIKIAFERLLENKDFCFIDDAKITRERNIGKNVYGFSWEKYGFDIAFSFEKYSTEIEKEIKLVYGSNGYLYGELKKSYQDNYHLRIYCGENVLNKKDKKISFLEAMVSATVIGNSFQPLFGIHDGLGILDELSLSIVKDDFINDELLSNYRKIDKNSKELMAFIHSVAEKSGNFVPNLYNAITSITKKIPDDGQIQLPEEFFKTKRGDALDYSLFFYDILKRKGYTVHFILIDNDMNNGELFSTVIFKEKNTDSWGWIDVEEFQDGKLGRMNRLPALRFALNVDYYEPDIMEIFNTKKINLPPPSFWNKSLY